MVQSRPLSDRRPKMLGTVKILTWLSRRPSDVAAPANARLGIVCVGADANQWSHTAKPRASPDMIGSNSGVYIPIISDGTVSGNVSLKCFARSEAIAFSKSITKPWLVGSAPDGWCSAENNCQFVEKKPSPGSAPGMK